MALALASLAKSQLGGDLEVDKQDKTHAFVRFYENSNSLKVKSFEKCEFGRISEYAPIFDEPKESSRRLDLKASVW